MSTTVKHRRAFRNEAFRVDEVRYVDDITGDPYVLVAAHMRGVIPVDGVDVEVFDVIPTQSMPSGWITAVVPQATMAVCPVGVGRYDMVLEFTGADRIRAVGGTLDVRDGVSEW